jgi:enoyl-CoA hydratase
VTSRDVLVERRGHVDLVTLNRPASRNALLRDTYEQLESAVRNTTARCLVVTGADPAFCAGDDIKRFMSTSELTNFLEEADELTTCTEAFLFTDVPVIAAVNGVAVGWGMELALLADIRIASEAARFGEVFVARGLCSDVPGAGLLARLVGREHAARLLLTGEIIGAERAAAIGLVSEVVPHADVVARALTLADLIAAHPPLAVAAQKASLREATDPDWFALGRSVRRRQAALSRTADHGESLSALISGRTPSYQGK